jgi:large subunit ribosomal protein L7/L12
VLRLEVAITTEERRLDELAPGLDLAALAQRVGKARAETDAVVLLTVDPNRKLDTIRVVRDLTGVGLQEAKGLVEVVIAGRAQTVDEELGVAAAATLVARLAEVQARAERLSDSWFAAQGDPRSAYLMIHARREHDLAALRRLDGLCDQPWLASVSRRRFVVLMSVPRYGKLRTVMQVRAATELSLREALELVDRVAGGAPQVVRDDLEPDEAERIRALFRRDESGYAEVRRHRRDR